MLNDVARGVKYLTHFLAEITRQRSPRDHFRRSAAAAAPLTPLWMAVILFAAVLLVGRLRMMIADLRIRCQAFHLTTCDS